MAGLKVIPVLQCSSLDGWYPKRIQSSSDEDRHYVVHVNPWANRSEQHVCECKGYQFRGSCAHQKQVHSEHCGWIEIEGPEEATPECKEKRMCPRCGGPASYAMYEVPDESG